MSMEGVFEDYGFPAPSDLQNNALLRVESSATGLPTPPICRDHSGGSCHLMGQK